MTAAARMVGEAGASWDDFARLDLDAAAIARQVPERHRAALDKRDAAAYLVGSAARAGDSLT